MQTFILQSQNFLNGWLEVGGHDVSIPKILALLEI